MNTKTVEQLREEFCLEKSILQINDGYDYSEWLEQKLIEEKLVSNGYSDQLQKILSEQKLLTLSPERGKEGKTAEENLKSFGKKDTSMQNNLSYPVYTENEVIRLMELHAQSTSKPVEPKISVTEENIDEMAKEKYPYPQSLTTALEIGTDMKRAYFKEGYKQCLKNLSSFRDIDINEDAIEKLCNEYSSDRIVKITYAEGIRKGLSLNQESAERNFVKVKVHTDDSSHWYILPNNLVDEFRKEMDDEDFVDSGKFGDKYGKYMTGGDLNNSQLFIQSKGTE